MGLYEHAHITQQQSESSHMVGAVRDLECDHSEAKLDVHSLQLEVTANSTEYQTRLLDSVNLGLAEFCDCSSTVPPVTDVAAQCP